MAPPRLIEIVPSLLSADLGRLAELLREVRSGGAAWVSVDVMDGHFVPNLSFGPQLVRLIKRATPLRADVHLMVTNPETVAPWFLSAGADRVTFHLEAAADARALLRAVRKAGAQAGIAVKPRTSEAGLLPLLDEADAALVMTVEPGFGGAKFLDAVLPKISAVRRAVDSRGLGCRVQVDGGVNLATVERAAAAGADDFVAGQGIFAEPQPAAAVRALKRAAQAARDGGFAPPAAAEGAK
ncbi:MAG: ribulose-phosphate 3-epimerase [Elusimicrobia bacterium]|nr:ribulose-phosphate 3-epimerase [Elusimicrobiota bacterium]